MPSDLRAALGVPFLGYLPAVPAKFLKNRQNPRDPQNLKNPSPLLERGVPAEFAEAIRAIRTAVIFASAAGGSRSVLVTSTAQGEGKSVVSSNLASALAQVGQRTLLIDADMRRPRVHEVFNCAQAPGLSNVLAGTSGARAAIRTTSRPNLSVLPAGHIPSDPMALLEPLRSRRLIEDLGKDYDWVVVDAPPVTPVTDAAVLSASVGSVVFVVGAEITKRRPAQVAMEQLVAARARVIGAVLNHATPRSQVRYAHDAQTDYTQAYGAYRV